MAELKTKATGDDVEAFLASIEDEGRRSDAVAVCGLIAKAAKAAPVMWGSAIVGFVHRLLRYPTGRVVAPFEHRRPGCAAGCAHGRCCVWCRDGGWS
jgi:hypothetical protein